MNPVEQQIHDAAPDPGTARFPLDIAAELRKPRNGPDGFDTLLAAIPGRRQGRGSYGLLAGMVVLLALAGVWILAALGPGAVPQPLPRRVPPDDSRLQQQPGGESRDPWREVFVSPPWQDPASSVSASFQIPTRWKVRRDAGSPDYPGLHVSVDDDAGITVAVLYLGRVPGPSSAPQCGKGEPGGGWQELETTAADTGAEALDPGLRGRFALMASTSRPNGPYSVRFGIVPMDPAGGWCPDSLRVESAGGGLVLAFSTAVTLPGAVQGRPQSSYARSFASWEETLQYRRSAEYETVKRMILSLRIGPVQPPHSAPK